MPDRSPLWGRLGAELRKIRKAAGLPQSEILGRQATVSLIENGQRLPSEDDVQKWLRYADEATALRVSLMLDNANNETRAWSDILAESSDPTLQARAAEENEAAQRVRTYDTGVIPGLLQVGVYARVVFTKLGRDNVTESVAERIHRQSVLYEAGRSFEFLLPATLLDCAIAPDVRPRQLGHLASMAAGTDSISLGIVPEHVLPGPSFMLFTPIDDAPSYVKMEFPTGETRGSSRKAVAAFETEWERLRSASIVDDDAVELIRSKAGRLS